MDSNTLLNLGVGGGVLTMMATITLALLRFVATRDKRLDDRIKALETARDECIKREAELSEELGELRAIVSRVEHGNFIATVVCGEDGVIAEWNAGATSLFGYSKDEAIGQSISMLVPLRLRGEHDKGFYTAVAEKRGPTKDVAALAYARVLRIAKGRASSL
jgi:PAS domain-containing protein